MHTCTPFDIATKVPTSLGGPGGNHKRLTPPTSGLGSYSEVVDCVSSQAHQLKLQCVTIGTVTMVATRRGG